MIVYIDTEFTDLHADNGPIRIISAGFVAENGREFYFELTDGYQEIDCSEFVLENVMPYLDHSKFGLTTAEAALKLKAWCEGLGEPVKFATDSPVYDFNLIAGMLYGQKVIIENLDKKPEYFIAVNVEYFINDYIRTVPDAIRHHALWDARALKSAIKKPK
jgi:hypothetical protein